MNDLLTVPPPSATDLERDAAADYTRGLRVRDEAGNKESFRRHGEWMYGVLPAWIRRAVAAEVELARLKNSTYCAYCGFTVDMDADGSVVAQHIATCDKHPMREVKAENERLRAALAPFAAYGSLIPSKQYDGTHVNDLMDGTPHRAPRPTLGDCRRAAEALGQEVRR